MVLSLFERVSIRTCKYIYIYTRHIRPPDALPPKGEGGGMTLDRAVRIFSLSFLRCQALFFCIRPLALLLLVGFILHIFCSSL